jgi:hypothetical protein
MKKIFLALLLFGCVIRSAAQGTLLSTPGTTIKTVNNAYIILDNMNVVNNGSFIQATGNGTTKFTGNVDVNISGNSTTTFDKIGIAKTSSKITLQQNLNVAGQVDFSSGLLDLTNSVLNLGTTGVVNGETETSRIFTLGNGYVQITSTLNAPVAANPGNLGAIITTTKNLGSVTIKRGHKAQLNVSGTTPGILRYYDILPAIDNGLKATLRFHYFDAELNGFNENSMELWRQEKKGWIYVGYSSRNATLNYIEKTGIASLSRWTLSGSINPSQKATNNIYTYETLKENSEIKNQLSVWPNPVFQLANVTINAINSSSFSLKLYDVKGSLILMRQGTLLAGKNTMNIEVNNLPSGIYNLVAEWGATIRKTKQLVKQ